MEKSSTPKEQETQLLQKQVYELERQLAKARSTLEKSRPVFRHEDQIQNNEHLSRALFDAPYPIMIRRDDGRVLMVNSAWTQLTGYALEDIPTLQEWTRKAYGEQALQRETFILEQGFSQTSMKSWGEYEVQTRFGAKRLWSFSTVPLGFDESGRELVMVMVVDVTERYAAETARAESERQQKKTERLLELDRARLSAILENLPVGVWIMDETGQIIGKNRQADLIWAGDAPLLANIDQYQQYESWYPESGRQLEPEEYPAAQAVRTGQPVGPVEVNIRRFDGTVGTVIISAVPIKDNLGKLTGVVAINMDITTRKRAEEARRESEQKFAIMFEKAPFAAALSKLPEGVIVNINEEFERLFGYTREEATGKTSLQLGLNPNETERANIIAQVQSSGSARNVETRLYTKSGEQRIFLLNIDLVHLGQDQYALQTAHDVTVSKEAEESLRESEKRFQSLADSMPQLVWTALPDGTVDYYNRRHQEYRDIKTVDGEAWEWSPVLHPDDVQSTTDAWQHAVATGTVYQIEHRVRMANGSYRWHLSRGIPMRDENGHVVRWFGTATDIHESKLAEEKLKDYAARLERSNRELEQFAFMASHDLQEPLRKIQVFGDLLLDRAHSLEGPEREYLDRMRNAAGRMREMINGLLQLSRVNTQSMPFTDIDLSQVTHEALSDLAVQSRETGGHVDVDALPVVKGDALQLRQLMQNLIGNALKYHKPGIPPRVKISASQTADTAQIFVEDNGIGFEQEHAERIFQPFQRLVGRSQYEGSGMGLAICRKIVERHGGEISAQSEPGQGTTFIIRLPLHTTPNSKKDEHE